MFIPLIPLFYLREVITEWMDIRSVQYVCFGTDTYRSIGSVHWEPPHTDPPCTPFICPSLCVRIF